MRPRPRRPRGGTLWSGLLTAGFAALFVSGLFLWRRPAAELLILLHAGCGLAVLLALVPWLSRHVPRAICHAQRPGFTAGSWLLLAVWVLLFGSGLAMVAPMPTWLLGPVRFPAREITEALSFVHFWASWAGMAGLVLHLALRHWRLPAADAKPGPAPGAVPGAPTGMAQDRAAQGAAPDGQEGRA